MEKIKSSTNDVCDVYKHFTNFKQISAVEQQLTRVTGGPLVKFESSTHVNLTTHSLKVTKH